MRAFIGVDFSRGLKKQIADLQLKLKSYALSGRWKYIDNFHLTLKFLDEIDLKQAAAISSTLKKICSRTGEFRLEISEMGSFSGKGCVRVLWLGLGGELDRLHNLQEEIDSRLINLGFKKEKRSYTPHVTIGQDIIFAEDFNKIRELAKLESFQDIHVDSVYLFKSEQIGNKRVYTPVNKYSLNL